MRLHMSKVCEVIVRNILDLGNFIYTKDVFSTCCDRGMDKDMAKVWIFFLSSIVVQYQHGTHFSWWCDMTLYI